MAFKPSSTYPPADCEEKSAPAGSKPAVREWVIPIVGTCGPALAAEVEEALLTVEGVSGARLNLGTSNVTVVGDPDRVRKQALYHAIQKTAYQARPESGRSRAKGSKEPHPRLRAAGLGAVAAAAVIGFYLGLIAMTSDWFNARAQLAGHRWWITALAVGLAVQVSLFVYVGAIRRGSAPDAVASGAEEALRMEKER